MSSLGHIFKSLSPDKEVILSTVSATRLVQKMWDEREWANPRTFLKTSQASLAALLIQGLNEEDSQQNVELKWQWENDSLKSIRASSLFQGAVCASYDWSGEILEDVPELKGIFQLRRVEGPYVSSGTVDSHGNIVSDLQDYLEKSEQRDTSFALSIRWKIESINGKDSLVISHAIGYCLHILPDQILDRSEILLKWQRVLNIMGNPADWQLSEDSSQGVRDMAALLYASQTYTDIFTKELNFFCSCSQTKVENILKALPEEEIALVEDEKFLEVTCKYCGKVYRVWKSALESKSG